MIKQRIKATAWTLAVLLVAAIVAAGCGGDGKKTKSSSTKDDAKLAKFDLSGATITVGSKDFTEQLVLGHIARIALEATGAKVKDQVGLAGTTAARAALESGEIDLYWEYTGTGWITFLGNTEPIADSQEQYEAVRDADLKKNNIVWSDYAPFNNTYALAVRADAFDKLGVETLSDLKDLIKDKPEEATICIESEFSTRDDGLPGLEKHYDIKFPKKNISLLDTGVVYERTAKGKPCNFGEVFATDGRIAALDLKLVEDDKAFFPIYNPSWTIRKELVDEHPDVLEVANIIAAALDNETMTELNRRVDVDGDFAKEVAEDWLKENDLI